MKTDFTSCRWAVELLGDEFDLSGACAFFERGENVRVQISQLVTGRSATILMTNDFEELASAVEVNDASKPIADFLNGILFVTDQKRKPLRTNAVYERQPDGNWGNGIVFGSVHMTGTARMRAIVSTAPGAIPRQEKWMKGAMEDQAASEALTYLRGEPDWFELYKAHETIKAKSDKFTETAQATRHSEDWCRREGIRKHMSIAEAREHVRLLVQNWLNSRFP
jgi:hypothetical protein